MKLIYPIEFKVKYIMPGLREDNNIPGTATNNAEIMIALKLTGKCMCNKLCTAHFKDGVRDDPK